MKVVKSFLAVNPVLRLFTSSITKLILIILILLIFVNINSCNGVTEPEIQPGRRDYVWKVDTLNYPYATLIRLWGSSPKDVWATSPGEAGKTISHFNGKSWSSYSVGGMNTPHSIWGDSYNNVFIAANGGEVWKYDGSSWTKFAEITKDGRSDISFNNIWGKSRNDFYVFGGYPDTIVRAYNISVIAHYHDNKWEILNTAPIFGMIARLYENVSDGKVYFQALKMGGAIHPDSTIIYEYSQKKYKKLYSSVWTWGEQAFLSLINNEVYFILGNRIAKRVNDQFQTFLKIDNPNFYQRMWGRSSRDLFFYMTDGLVHYNGSNFEYLLHFDKPRTHVVGSALFEKDVFFLVYESATKLNLIYRGKIN
jgi:hypothetical protein